MTVRRGLAASWLSLAVLAVSGDLVLAHTITGRVNVPLPFVVYLAGAALAVALSFAFVAITEPSRRDRASTARPPPTSRPVPGWVRAGLKTIGLVGWSWIVAQTIVGGASDADVASLFLWTYGWVGIAAVCALVGPIWSWIDPFSTLYDLLAGAARRLGIGGNGDPASYPAVLSFWPAVAGFAFFIWLELVAGVLGYRDLGLVLIGYTLVTLTGMAQFGRDQWRRHGEVFSVWFGVLGRLAPFGLAGEPEDGRIVRRPFGSALAAAAWPTSLVCLLALGTSSILYDGLSQTELFFRVFGLVDVPTGTLLMGAFFATVLGIVVLVGRIVGQRAVGAGLVPVATGYLIAHYLSSLVLDGQRIVIALSDPLQQGWDLFGFAFFQPDASWLSPTMLWTVQLGAVVGGHVVGAWAGHSAMTADVPRASRVRQVPLAAMMVGLTTATLWSLGQGLVFVDEGEAIGAQGGVAVAGRMVPGDLFLPDGHIGWSDGVATAGRSPAGAAGVGAAP